MERVWEYSHVFLCLAVSTELLVVWSEAMLGHQAEVLFKAGKCSYCPPCRMVQKKSNCLRELGWWGVVPPPASAYSPFPVLLLIPPSPTSFGFVYTVSLFSGVITSCIQGCSGERDIEGSAAALLLKNLRQMCLEFSSGGSGGCQCFVAEFCWFFFFVGWFFGHTALVGWGCVWGVFLTAVC